MRLFVSAVLAGLLLAPVAAKAECASMALADLATVAAVMPAVQPAADTATDLSAAKKKEKVEYMKSAAGPEPKPMKPKKMKKKKM